MPAIVTSLILYIYTNAGRKKYKGFAYKNYRHFTQQCLPKVAELNLVLNLVKSAHV